MATTVKNWATVRRGKVFRSLHSNPRSWSFNGQCIYQQAHCHLCETPIVWRYGLQNEDTGKVLFVGSECIKWYYEAYMPNGLELALERMKEMRKKVKKQLIFEKIQKFSRAGNYWVVDYLFGPARRGYLDARLMCNTKNGEEFIRVSKFRASLRRKGYLRPDEIEAFRSGYDRAYHGLHWDRQLELGKETAL